MSDKYYMDAHDTFEASKAKMKELPKVQQKIRELQHTPSSDDAGPVGNQLADVFARVEADLPFSAKPMQPQVSKVVLDNIGSRLAMLKDFSGGPAERDAMCKSLTMLIDKCKFSIPAKLPEWHKLATDLGDMTRAFASDSAGTALSSKLDILIGNPIASIDPEDIEILKSLVDTFSSQSDAAATPTQFTKKIDKAIAEVLAGVVAIDGPELATKTADILECLLRASSKNASANITLEVLNAWPNLGGLMQKWENMATTLEQRFGNDEHETMIKSIIQSAAKLKDLRISECGPDFAKVIGTPMEQSDMIVKGVGKLYIDQYIKASRVAVDHMRQQGGGSGGGRQWWDGLCLSSITFADIKGRAETSFMAVEPITFVDHIETVKELAEKVRSLGQLFGMGAEGIECHQLGDVEARPRHHGDGHIVGRVVAGGRGGCRTLARSAA